MLYPIGKWNRNKTSSFKNAGVGPCLTQEAGWQTLSVWGSSASFLIHLVSSFALSSMFSVFGKQSFGPSKWIPLWVMRKAGFCCSCYSKSPGLGPCVHTGCASACSEAVFLRGGDLIITKVAAKRAPSWKMVSIKRKMWFLPGKKKKPDIEWFYTDFQVFRQGPIGDPREH